MLHKPIFKHHFHVEVAADENIVYLLSETHQYYLKGYLYCMMADSLDGKHTVTDIVNQLELFYPRKRVEAALSHLEKRGFISEADTVLPPSQAAFWQLQDVSAAAAEKQLTTNRITVDTVGAIEIEPFVNQLKALNIQIAPDGDVAIVLTDDYLQPVLHDINQNMILAEKPWLLVKPVGRVIWIGPLFIPGETGCWQCLAHRLRGNREVESALLHQKARTTPFPTSRAALPTTLHAGYSLTATQVALYLAGGDSFPLKGNVATMDIATLSCRKHVLTKRPQCAVCGTSIEAYPTPVKIETRRKGFTEDGGHRIQSPAETLRKFQHLVSPITGVVGELKPIFIGGNGLVSIYCGVHEIPGNNQLLEQLQASLRNNATGKGKSEVQSQASAFSEAVERYSALYRGNGYRVRRSLNQMEEDVIPLEACLLFSQLQYQDRKKWNRTHLGLDYVPVSLDPGDAIDWTPVWSLTAHAFKYVPTAHCYLGYVDDTHDRPIYYNHDSNGLAAGNVIEEAVLQGFMELVERDCVSIWWYNRLIMPGVDLESFADPYVEALAAYYQSLGREFWVLDLTSDTKIPTFAAISRRMDGGDEAITFGFGTHFDARIGISRALTEMNQALYLHRSGRTSLRVKSDREIFMRQWNQTATIENQLYLSPDPTVTPRPRDAYNYRHNNDIGDDIQRCIEIANGLGLEVLVHDLTQPDIGMNVVKVIVPGLRTFRARFAPGRLYDVPVSMGWRQRRLDESELNPICWWL